MDEQREAAETLFRQMDTALKGLELVAVDQNRRALTETRELRKTADIFRALAGVSIVFVRLLVVLYTYCTGTLMQ